MSRKFTVQSQITGIRALADGGLSLNIHTKELPAIEKVTVMDFQNKVGWLLFSENEVQEEEIPEGDAEFNQKTPSQRQRAIIWRIWEAQGKQGDQEVFYRQMMDKIAERLKNKYLD